MHRVASLLQLQRADPRVILVREVIIMTKVAANTEGSILDILRDLEAGKAHATPTVPPAAEAPVDPVELRASIQENLKVVCALEGTKFRKMLEGTLGGKSLPEVKRDLQSALADLDIMIDGKGKEAS